MPFEVPEGVDFDARLSSVLQAIYLVFNEGYSATAGEDWLRPELCHDALRLGRVLVGLLFEQEMTAVGAARILGIEPSGVRMRKKRLLEKLAKKLAGLWP